MSLKSYLTPRIAERIFSQGSLDRRRAKTERARVKSGEPHKVEFFHDPSDPYSQLLQQALPAFQTRYKIELLTHIVGPPDDGAVPEREALTAYAKTDAMRLAKKAGIDFALEDRPAAANTDVATNAADARLKQLGHYLGGTLYYGGEWYWGLDRLHYLEDRLAALCVQNNNTAAPLYSPPTVPSGSGDTGAELHWYLSFRSPYTAIVRDRVKALADAYGAELKLRFVLPMVMRGLPVPPAKSKYIPLDTAREARRLGVPFGRIIDPVGKPVEMGYSLLPWAQEQGCGYDYVQSWLSGTWAEGIDAGSLKGLRIIVERAGLDWNAAKDIVGNDDWRSIAEANRAEMMDRGIWGVPSFRVGETITWGQDRLWVAEHALQKLTTA
ncbi:MAG: DsbA family protein [Maricaulaceae bacterium]